MIEMIVQNSPHQTDENLWYEWQKKKNEEIANELVKRYRYLVTFHVERMAVKVPQNISKDDLESYGFMGLYDAIHKFDPKRDLKFDTYASYRIRGAIIDGLRKEDWLPRTLREKVKKIEETSEYLEQKLKRMPTAEEISKEVNMTKEEVETAINDSLFANVLSIDGPTSIDKNDDFDHLKYMIKDENTETPDELLIKEEVYNSLVEEIKDLNQNEQLVISLFYYDELTMTEIGEVLDLTTSRISQIHKSAIFKLRNSLKKMIHI